MSAPPTWKDLQEDPFLKESLRSSWFRYLLFGLAIFFLVGMVQGCYLPTAITPFESGSTDAGVSAGNPNMAELPRIDSMEQRVNQVRTPYKVGLIVGHRGSDSGAVCGDGLTEVSVTESVASNIVGRLQEEGIQVSLFGEYDARLVNFKADAVISLHADSCGFELSGYKTAVSASTFSPQLQECVNTNYEKITNLSFHSTTVTPDMTAYHAFSEVHIDTPTLILEMGFLDGDRELLIENQDLVASAVTKGLTCYLTQK